MPSILSIPLPGNQTLLIDECDSRLIDGYVLHLLRTQKGALYAQVELPGRKRAYVHRLILDAPDGVEVDHKNGNGLDCTRGNLRLATHSQNCANRKVPKRGNSETAYRGIFRQRSGRWTACLTSGGKKRSVGTFDDEVSAALAYDRAAVGVWGEFATLNFPVDSYPQSIHREHLCDRRMAVA